MKVCYVYVVKLMRRALISVSDVLKGLLFGHIYLTTCLWIFLHAVNVQYVHTNDNSGLHGECVCVTEFPPFEGLVVLQVPFIL